MPDDKPNAAAGYREEVSTVFVNFTMLDLIGDEGSQWAAWSDTRQHTWNWNIPRNGQNNQYLLPSPRRLERSLPVATFSQQPLQIFWSTASICDSTGRRKNKWIIWEWSGPSNWGSHPTEQLHSTRAWPQVVRRSRFSVRTRSTSNVSLIFATWLIVWTRW